MSSPKSVKLAAGEKPAAHQLAEEESQARIKEAERAERARDLQRRRRESTVGRVVAKTESRSKKYQADDGDIIEKTTHKARTRHFIGNIKTPRFDKVSGVTTYEEIAFNEVLPFRTDKCKALQDGFTSLQILEVIKTYLKTTPKNDQKIDLIMLTDEDLAIEDEMAKDTDLQRAIANRQMNVERQDPFTKALNDPFANDEPLAPLVPLTPIQNIGGQGLFNSPEMPAHLQELETDYV